MKDFIESREAGGASDIRVDVPVFLPGYSAIGKRSADEDTLAPSVLATLYSIPNQFVRVVRRRVNKARNPDESVYKAAELRNFEVVFTSTEVQFCPASPLLSKAEPPVSTLPLAETTVHFETRADAMSDLTIDGEVWHVHPEYAGDVRWALRRIADDYPEYNFTFGS